MPGLEPNGKLDFFHWIRVRWVGGGRSIYWQAINGHPVDQEKSFGLVCEDNGKADPDALWRLDTPASRTIKPVFISRAELCRERLKRKSRVTRCSSSSLSPHSGPESKCKWHSLWGEPGALGSAGIDSTEWVRVFMFNNQMCFPLTLGDRNCPEFSWL